MESGVTLEGIRHLHGIAVLFDVVYNHAGSGNVDSQSL
jgi:pullulanase/glycogen debranching enzyme